MRQLSVEVCYEVCRELCKIVWNCETKCVKLFEGTVVNCM